jgi:hypothetical protein
VPYEIEHIISEGNNGQRAKQGIGRERNRLGALLILPKSVNASLRDAPYDRKVEQYHGQNKLAASLHKESYASRGNPGFARFRKSSGLTRSFRSFPSFGLAAIDSRQELYRNLCELVWNPASLGIPTSTDPRTASVPRQPQTRSKVELSDLIEIGLIEANEQIFGSAGRFTATIRADGSVTVESGETFGSLSGAGRFVMESKSSGGWDFWRVRRNDVLVPLAKIRAEALERAILAVPLRRVN